MKPVDLTRFGVIAKSDIDAAARDGATEILVRDGVALTPSARDAMARHRIVARASGTATSPSGAAGRPGQPGAGAYGGAPAARARVSQSVRELFRSREAEAVKAEIVATGRKLWQRHYVDGNGGNISCRVGPNEVICTPTLCSKADLTPEDLCLVDLEGNELTGTRPRTSEILLHLEIYKAVPQAKGVVHCHPPHATAYAVVGRVPPASIIPEYDVFIGRVAWTPYETPGTQAFAETVLPFVRNYNTVLLGNHGIVCWADTVTHAEWYAEVLETYCWTLGIASQLGAPIARIPEAKQADLLKIKERMGLPDPRFNAEACHVSETPVAEPGAIVVAPPPPCSYDEAPVDRAEVDAIVRDVTAVVLEALGKRTSG